MLYFCMTYSLFTFFSRNVRFSRFLVHDAATANAIVFMKDLVKPKAPFAPTFFQFYGQTAFIVKAFSTIESLWSVTFMFSDVAALLLYSWCVFWRGKCLRRWRGKYL